MKLDNLFKLVIAVAVSELAGIIGSVFTVTSIQNWYATIMKPPLNPPNWIFAPVWTAIFILMGISLYLVWSERFVVKNELKIPKRRVWNNWSGKLLSGKWQKANIILIFILQLILNVLWSIIFFGAHSPGAAFFELLMLWFAIIFTIINFCRVSKTAALLLLPYILWVSFAAILNYFIWILN